MSADKYPCIFSRQMEAIVYIKLSCSEPIKSEQFCYACYNVHRQVNFGLRRLANKKGPCEDELNMLANSVDEFTTSLLDPLKSHTEDRRAFGDSLDDVIDAGISLEQKKVTFDNVNRRFDVSKIIFKIKSSFSVKVV